MSNFENIFSKKKLHYSNFLSKQFSFQKGRKGTKSEKQRTDERVSESQGEAFAIGNIRAKGCHVNGAGSTRIIIF